MVAHFYQSNSPYYYQEADLHWQQGQYQGGSYQQPAPAIDYSYQNQRQESVVPSSAIPPIQVFVEAPKPLGPPIRSRRRLTSGYSSRMSGGASAPWSTAMTASASSYDSSGALSGHGHGRSCCCGKDDDNLLELLIAAAIIMMLMGRRRRRRRKRHVLEAEPGRIQSGGVSVPLSAWVTPTLDPTTWDSALDGVEGFVLGGEETLFSFFSPLITL